MVKIVGVVAAITSSLENQDVTNWRPKTFSEDPVARKR